MFKKLSGEMQDKIEAEVRRILHASRDTMRNRGQDTTKFSFDATNSYYGEAIGVFQALKILGYGNFGAINTPELITNFSWWMRKIEADVLQEEGYNGNNQCDFCFEKYRKDSVRGR